MNKDIKKQWVDALRSGKYKQGKTRLKTCHGEYCCLGVLCEILNIPNQAGTYSYKNNSSIGSLPGPLRFELEVSTDLLNKLTNMNDGGSSFDEIADYIEANL